MPIKMKNGVLRAPTMIVTGPGHLIGSQQQVDQFLNHNKGELPPWFKEWHELLGEQYHMRILQTPYDVGEFFRSAVRDPHTPRVGFIANTVLSLGSGYTTGVEDWSGSVWARKHARANADQEEVEQKALDELRKARRKAARAQAASDAAAREDDQARPTLPAGVSPRTQARDLLFGLTEPLWNALPGGGRMMYRTHTPLLRNGLCCPACGRLVRTNKLEAATSTTLKKLGLARLSCDWCGTNLGQMAREQDNVGDRDLELFQSDAWRTKHPDVPWGERPTSNPRYALGRLIGRRWKGWLDIYIADEVHDYKGRTTAIGAAFGAMVSAARYTVGLTGTLFGGYASTLYSLFLRLGNVPVLQEYGWDDEKRFVQENGVVADITREVQRINDAGHFSGEPKVETDQQELPGITANLGAVVQNQAIQVLLKHMGFNLVDYIEDAVFLDMPDDIATAYRRLEDGGKKVIAFGGHDALSSYLQATLSYPYQPWTPKTIASKRKQESVDSEIFPSDRILPHHEWLARYAAEQVTQGRRVLVYAEHTMQDDILQDVAEKITHLAAQEHGATLKVATLRSTTVKPGDRAAWFAQREAEGYNVVLCNPRLVKTGLNLIGWPSIVVLEPVYSLYTLAQAVRRGFRPTQTRHCEVIYLCYADSMSERALSIAAEKLAALALLSGDEISDGFAAVGQGMSLMQELAKLVTQGEGDAMNKDVRAMLASNAQALKASMEAGASELLGVDTSRVAAVERVAASPTITLEVVDVAEAVTLVVQGVATPAPARSNVPMFGSLDAIIKTRKARRIKPGQSTDAGVEQLDLFNLAASPLQTGHTQQALF
jgi:hypothetical protein